MPGRDESSAPRRRSPRFTAHRPHVALLVETSLASGRDILRGIARYVREHERWALYHEPRSLEETLPSWLRRWQGDGIIVRAQNDRIAQAVQATADRQVAAALRFIREYACQGLTAVDVVAHVPVSRSVLQRRFRKELGRSIQEEIVHTRLKRARQLLAETDLPLIEVAERSGFKHQEYLGALFKAKTGTTPAQYRRETYLT
jgi:AraC-like DNA-binding protein